jgi:hypothetical protein
MVTIYRFGSGFGDELVTGLELWESCRTAAPPTVHCDGLCPPLTVSVGRLRLGADGVAADPWENRGYWRRSKKVWAGSDTAEARPQLETPKPPSPEAEHRELGLASPRLPGNPTSPSLVFDEDHTWFGPTSLRPV